MPRMMGVMTLKSLLEQHGIHTIRELTHRTGLSRQQCWNLWHGYSGVGRATLKLLHETLKIPYDELLQVDPIPHAQRPRRTRPAEEGPAHE
jgi:transcriptional regulator with XRE-family HTH domain